MLEKPKFRGRLVEEYGSVKEILPGLSESAKTHYPCYIGRFCEFLNKDPDEILAERRRHLKSDDERVRRTYERTVHGFYEGVKEKARLETSAYQVLMAVQGFFSRNYARLEFGRRGPRRPKTVARDYVPPIAQVREIVECASVRNKAIFLTMLQTGLAPVDVSELRRGWFEGAVQAGEYPVLITDINREKTRVPQRVVIGHDAGAAIKRYFGSRTDDSQYLFVELRRKGIVRDGKGRIVGGEVQQLEPRFIDSAFQKAVKRTGIQVPKGLRLRVYSLRKIFETQAGKVMPQAWVDLLMGHSIAGARAAYIVPNGDELLEAYRKAEPLISITGITKPTEKEIEALVSERTSELAGVVEERGKRLRTLEGENRELKSKLGGLGRRVRTLELMEARRLGLSVPELRELSTDQAELARRLKKWASEE